jgi:hypothetical protein
MAEPGDGCVVQMTRAQDCETRTRHGRGSSLRGRIIQALSQQPADDIVSVGLGSSFGWSFRLSRSPADELNADSNPPITDTTNVDQH